jgi:AcrR family transcriptional regulator
MDKVMTNRERLLLAARELFFEQGYDASVDAIIGRAEVARQTFYNHFKNKESLFAEVVRDSFLDVLAPLNDDTDDFRQSLMNFAGIYRQRVLSPERIAAYRILSSQAQRFPELVREVYELGAGKMIERLADFLCKAMVQNYICHADPVFAAEMLIAMLVGQERSQLLFGVHRRPEDEALKIANVVDGFLKMFSSEQKSI